MVHVHGTVLTYFAEVARTGSIAAASQNLHVAVSAISRQIARLEKEIGAALFERMPRGMVLTSAGEIFAQHVRRTLLESDAVLAEISGGYAHTRDIVRIGCAGGLTTVVLPAAMASFHHEHPLARFVVRSGDAALVQQWVAAGEVDVGIICTMSASAAVDVVLSARAPVHALCRPGHPLADKAVLTLQDMLDHPLVVPERGLMMRQLFDLCCSARGRQFEPVLVTDNLAIIRRFAALTDGIALWSDVISSDPGATDALIAKRIDEPLLNEHYLQFITMHGRRLPHSVSRFIEVLQQAPGADMAGAFRHQISARAAPAAPRGATGRVTERPRTITGVSNS